MKILLTNDDSHRSPLLAFIIQKLKTIGELVVVVPKHEQSWKGKSITRFGYLHQEEMEIAGYKAFTVDGTPADCVNIGINHLCGASKPDLVISGINAGLNAGCGFIFSSGTVGACLEANIAGLPAIALSQHFDDKTFETYIASYSIAPSTFERLCLQTDGILNRLLPKLVNKNNFAKNAITWNVNLPFETNVDTRIVPSSVGYSLYGSCFAKRDLELGSQSNGKIARFEHELREVYEDRSESCDSRMMRQGHVTVTPLNIASFGQITEEERVQLETLLS